MSFNRNDVTGSIIGCAIDVHRELGPGLLESAYEECLAYELHAHDLEVERQIPIPVVYKKVRLECGYRLDLLVNHEIIVEIKSVDAVLPVHEAQILTYLRFAHKHLGLLLNFNGTSLRQRIRRFIL